MSPLRHLLIVGLVAVVGAGSVLPVLGAYRCPTMGRRSADGCCHPALATAGDPDSSEGRAADGDGHHHLAPRCCDPLAAPALPARAGSVRADDGCQGAHAPLLAVLPPPASLVTAVDVSWRHYAAQPRGRPPGDLLDLFGSVLRV